MLSSFCRRSIVTLNNCTKSSGIFISSRGFLTSQEPRIVVSKTNDPYFNKSMEDYLFKHTKGSGPLLYLWQNDNTVFIGRNQNPWKECNLVAMKEDKVNLVRRFSGGGAVYQVILILFSTSLYMKFLRFIIGYGKSLLEYL